MPQHVKLSHLRSALEELHYPVERDEAAAAFDDTIVLLADGEIPLGRTIEHIPSERFENAGELASDLNNVLPREAVGEPYQSEGEG